MFSLRLLVVILAFHAIASFFSSPAKINLSQTSVGIGQSSSKKIAKVSPLQPSEAAAIKATIRESEPEVFKEEDMDLYAVDESLYSVDESLYSVPSELYAEASIQEDLNLTPEITPVLEPQNHHFGKSIQIENMQDFTIEEINQSQLVLTFNPQTNNYLLSLKDKN